MEKININILIIKIRVKKIPTYEKHNAKFKLKIQGHTHTSSTGKIILPKQHAAQNETRKGRNLLH